MTVEQTHAGSSTPLISALVKGLSNFQLDGTDHSANAPALPAQLLVSIGANKSRRGFFVQNQDATNSITVVFLDSAGANGSQLILAPGGTAGSQGGSTSMGGTPHTGQIKIYSASAATKMGARTWE